MTELLAGVGSLIAGAGALGGWYLLRARRDQLDAQTEHTHVESLLQMWDKAINQCTQLEERIDELETKYRDCRNKKRSLEAVAIEHGVPIEAIQRVMG